MNLSDFGVPFLAEETVKDLVTREFGETAANTIQWAGAIILGVLTIILFVWTIVVFVKSQTESDMTQQKIKKKQALKLLIVAIVFAILSTSLITIFLELPVGDFSGAPSITVVQPYLPTLV